MPVLWRLSFIVDVSVACGVGPSACPSLPAVAFLGAGSTAHDDFLLAAYRGTSGVIGRVFVRPGAAGRCGCVLVVSPEDSPRAWKPSLAVGWCWVPCEMCSGGYLSRCVGSRGGSWGWSSSRLALAGGPFVLPFNGPRDLHTHNSAPHPPHTTLYNFTPTCVRYISYFLCGSSPLLRAQYVFSCFLALLFYSACVHAA